ncbi:MAG: hypothetical protein GX811_02025 [Lentisphaerae bacterium]|nr:hypothetical protein [Lentisphaerota bacterium]
MPLFPGSVREQRRFPSPANRRDEWLALKRQAKSAEGFGAVKQQKCYLARTSHKFSAQSTNALNQLPLISPVNRPNETSILGMVIS